MSTSQGKIGTMDRYWDKVDQSGGPTACWPWVGTRHVKGYGKAWVNRKWMMAHRRSWELHHGSIPDGLFVCHTCDNPPCVNPDHLWLGTLADNLADMRAKGRQFDLPHYSGDLHPRRLHPERWDGLRGPHPDRDGHRNSVGELNSMAKLTADQVRLMRTLHAEGRWTFRRLGALFGVNAQTAHRIVRRQRWAEVA